MLFGTILDKIRSGKSKICRIISVDGMTKQAVTIDVITKDITIIVKGDKICYS